MSVRVFLINLDYFMITDKKKEKIKKIRIDELLVQSNLVTNIDIAQRMILAGQVICNDQLISKASTLVNDNSTIRFKNSLPYVGRGGLKLEGACKDLGLDSSFFQDKVVLDIGASTGGFSDYALQHGARYVIALDVGTNQLAWKLRSHPQIICVENTNITEFEKQDAFFEINKREQEKKEYGTYKVIDSIDIVLADISFNSLARLASCILNLTDASYYILLVKPQFELPRLDVPEGGVVKDPLLQQKALKLVEDSFINLGLTDIKSVPSRIKGHSGNQESFIYIKNKKT